jgi:hypothetical protein
LDRLQNMSIYNYTNLNRTDTQCYWIEKECESLEGKWDGSAYKFDIYKRENFQNDDTRVGYYTDVENSGVRKFRKT